MPLVRYEQGDRLWIEGELLHVVGRANNRWGGDSYRVARTDGSGARWITPRTVGARARVLDKEGIATLVHAFYDRVRADEVLGPIFEARLRDRWEPHLAKMVSFWSSVMLREGSFDGDPPGTHRGLEDARPEHFERWLSLFDATTDEVFAESLADALKQRARAMARGLSGAMFGRPYDDRPMPQGST
ncbi:MAG: group III truncated hemoglobin [Polyangiales bacterium]